MIEERPDESRIEYLSRVLIEFMYMGGVGEATIDYDGTTCDGWCLAQDIADTIEITKALASKDD